MSRTPDLTRASSTATTASYQSSNDIVTIEQVFELIEVVKGYVAEVSEHLGDDWGEETRKSACTAFFKDMQDLMTALANSNFTTEQYENIKSVIALIKDPLVSDRLSNIISGKGSTQSLGMDWSQSTDGTEIEVKGPPFGDDEEIIAEAAPALARGAGLSLTRTDSYVNIPNAIKKGQGGPAI